MLSATRLNLIIRGAAWNRKTSRRLGARQVTLNRTQMLLAQKKMGLKVGLEARLVTMIRTQMLRQNQNLQK